VVIEVPVASFVTTGQELPERSSANEWLTTTFSFAKTQADEAETGATAEAEASSELFTNCLGGVIALQLLPFQCPTSSVLVSHGLPHLVPAAQASRELSAAMLASSDSGL
jgi:hypothetical protein